MKCHSGLNVIVIRSQYAEKLAVSMKVFLNTNTKNSATESV